ncbi:hypothetical protein POM88_006250 [Heracleum sosnowskyi]|uniref:Uncharacterized protein n=1 Tax=Heracleum sosnowskyi TaxID=360622 RepID=A0AAD8J5N3_9APIA|nr:hypothetical protein POM88_006250 [Heracleum sosnowskyi]
MLIDMLSTIPREHLKSLFSMEHRERHLWHLDKLPARYFACNLKRNGFESRINALSFNSSDEPDRYFLAKSDVVYQDTKDLPFDDLHWGTDDEYDADGNLIEKGWQGFNWLKL